MNAISGVSSVVTVPVGGVDPAPPLSKRPGSEAGQGEKAGVPAPGTAISPEGSAGARPLGRAGATEASTVAASLSPGERNIEEASAFSPNRRQEIEEAAKRVERMIATLNRNLQFQVDEETKKLVIKVIDAATKEVIKQIPPQELIEIAKALDKVQGLLVREKA
ncbi:MAG: flagellar protein FlaG [Hydrogenophilus sp.]|nr:flagellar protein FlaG [Hydrogenophilus sp.]